VEVGDVEHLTTWKMRVCYVDPENLHTHQRPQTVIFPDTSTERAELENFADAVAEHRPLALAGGDEEHNVAVLEAILESARIGRSVQVGSKAETGGEPAPRPLTTRAAVPAKRAVKTVKKAAHKPAKKTRRAAQTTSRAAKKKKPQARSAKKRSTAARRAAAKKPVRRARRR
jgi:hypothetical protein